MPFHTMTRLISASLTVLALPLLLMSCSTIEPQPPVAVPKEEATTHINFVASEYSSETRPLLEGLVREFMLKNPSIVIDLQVANWDILDTIYTTMISKNQPPDLLNTNVYTHFANDGLLNDMNDIMSPELKKKFYPDLLKMDEWKGKQYAIPYLSTTRNLYYNKDLFQEAGIQNPPATWTELEEAAKKIKETGKASGFGVDLTDNEIQAYLSYFFFGSGGDWIKDGRWVINSKENIEGLTFLKELYMKGLSDPDPTVTTRDEKHRILGDGKLGMMISGNYFTSVMPREFPDLNWGVGPIPVKEGNPPLNFGVHDVLVSFKTDHTDKEALSKFLDYLYSSPIYEDIVQREGFLPVTEETGAKLSATDGVIKQNLAELRKAKFYPIQRPEWQSIMDTARKMGDAILHDHVTPEQALNELQKFAEEKSRQMNKP